LEERERKEGNEKERKRKEKMEQGERKIGMRKNKGTWKEQREAKLK
jgi:hypothetical protein